MNWRGFLGFFACFAFGFACARTSGSDAGGTVATLCTSNDDCSAAESCELRMGAGVCRPRARDDQSAAGGGDDDAHGRDAGGAGYEQGCDEDSDCGDDERCEDAAGAVMVG